MSGDDGRIYQRKEDMVTQVDRMRDTQMRRKDGKAEKAGVYVDKTGRVHRLTEDGQTETLSESESKQREHKNKDRQGHRRAERMDHYAGLNGRIHKQASR